MLWELENPNAYAEHDRLDALEEEVPDELWPPELLPGVSEWFEAFRELGTDRQVGFSIGPIPAASIARHTQGWDEVEAERFRLVMRVVDSVFLNFTHEGSTAPPPLPTQTMGPELFDALFGRE